MKSCRWQLLAAALTLMGAAVPEAAHAQAGAPPEPKTIDFGSFFPGVARFVSTIDDFEGTVAVANIQGTGTDNKGNTLQFEVDVRPMQGVYADPMGFLHLGTFTFTWLDLFSGSGANRQQIHDFHFFSNSPPFAKSGDAHFGPFWTGAVPETSLTGSPYAATMSLDLKNIVQSDSFVVFGPTELPAMASIHVDWTTGLNGLFPTAFEQAPTYVAQSPAAGFTGEYTLSDAHIDFSVTTQVSATDSTSFTFTSNPEGQKVLFAQVGHEEDGRFMH